MALLDLEEMKTFLNVTGTNDDVEIENAIDEAEATIAARCGDLQPTPRTRKVRARGASILLPEPIVSVQSITPPTGPAVALTGVDVDEEAGVLTSAAFAGGRYTVAYTSGRPVDECPADLMRAVAELVKSMYSTTQRGSGRFQGTRAAAEQAFLLSYRVQDLIAPHRQAGIA